MVINLFVFLLFIYLFELKRIEGQLFFLHYRPTVKHKAIKFLEYNIGENLDDLVYGNKFLNKTSKTGFIKERVDKLDLIKIDNFCSAIDNIKRMRRHATNEYIYKRHI